MKNFKTNTSICITILSILLIILSTSSISLADYVIVKRKAIFKEEPHRSGKLINRPKIGSRFELLQNDKIKGYYFVKDIQTGQEGYLYKTLVSRHHDTDNSSPLGIEKSYPTHELKPSFFNISTPNVYFHFINVGQADATLVEFPCGVILIDAGKGYPSKSKVLTDYLDKFFSDRPKLKNVIDAVYITHNHSDHANRIVDVLKKYKVKRYFDNGEIEEKYQKKAREYIRNNSQQTLVRTILDDEVVLSRTGLTDNEIDPIQCENCDPTIKILSGGFEKTSPYWHVNPNNRSLVIRIDFGETSALFTGDLQTEVIELLTEFYNDDILDIDIYQVGHHGADNGTTLEFVKEMTPELVVFSMGDPNILKGNRSAYGHGHPKIKVIKLLNNFLIDQRFPSITNVAYTKRRTKPKKITINKRMYGTGWDGNIVIKGDLEGHLEVAISLK